MFWRNKKVFIFLAALPVLCCLLILWFQYLANSFSSIEIKEFPEETPQISRCKGDGCITVGVGIVGDSKDFDSPEYEWISHTLDYFYKFTNLSQGTDVKIVSIGSANDYKSYLDNNQGKVNFGIVFCTTTFKDESLTNISLPCQPENINKGPTPTNMYFYTLIYNYTMAPSPFGQNFSVPVLFYVPVLQMKAAVDNGIMDYLGKKHQMPNPPQIDLTYSYMPLPPN